MKSFNLALVLAAHCCRDMGPGADAALNDFTLGADAILNDFTLGADKILNDLTPGAGATLNMTIMLDDGEGHAVEMPRIAAGTWQYEYRKP